MLTQSTDQLCRPLDTVELQRHPDAHPVNWSALLTSGHSRATKTPRLHHAGVHSDHYCCCIKTKFGMQGGSRTNALRINQSWYHIMVTVCHLLRAFENGLLTKLVFSKVMELNKLARILWQHCIHLLQCQNPETWQAEHSWPLTTAVGECWS